MLASGSKEAAADGPDGGQAAGQTGRLEITVPATNAGGRTAIRSVLAMIDETATRREDLDLLEIALAEVLNNVVEHAYSNAGDGLIEVVAEKREPGLHLTIWDQGAPMPSGRLPGGAPADPERDPHEQAEGGYGLFMIRQLARKLRYERVGDRNRLTFRIPLSAP